MHLFVLARYASEVRRDNKRASYRDREGALALFEGWPGYDLGKYGDDEDFRFLDTAPPAVRSMVNHWAKTSPQGTKWNKKAIAEQLILGGNGAKLIRSPTTVADDLERWVEVADILSLLSFRFYYPKHQIIPPYSPFPERKRKNQDSEWHRHRKINPKFRLPN